MDENEIRNKAMSDAVSERVVGDMDLICRLRGELAVMQDRYNKAQAEILALKTPKPAES